MRGIHAVLGVAAALLGLAAAVADGRPAATAAASGILAPRDHITAPELAARIMRQDASLVVVDLRPQAAYDELHIPTAISVPLDQLADRVLPPEAAIVLYADGGNDGTPGFDVLRRRGYGDVRVLREGLYEWLARVLEPRLASDATAAERVDFERAEVQSRFFGGQPRSSVPRAEVPTGYWNETRAAGVAGGWRPSPAAGRSAAEAIRATVGTIRRRGC
jgi:rhodanese-related sulfurtransferase